MVLIENTFAAVIAEQHNHKKNSPGVCIIYLMKMICLKKEDLAYLLLQKESLLHFALKISAWYRLLHSLILAFHYPAIQSPVNRYYYFFRVQKLFSDQPKNNILSPGIVPAFGHYHF